MQWLLSYDPGFSSISTTEQPDNGPGVKYTLIVFCMAATTDLRTKKLIAENCSFKHKSTLQTFIFQMVYPPCPSAPKDLYFSRIYPLLG
jgi:hypothetical protein